MALTKVQLDALNGINDFTPDQSAQVLGHSTGVMGNILSAAKSMAGGIANEAVRFGQSAVHAPGDIVNELQGKGPDTSTLPNFTGEGQQTFQGEFASKTVPDVNAGKTSPLAATANTFGGVLGGALDFLGIGPASKVASKVAKPVAETAAKATSKVFEGIRPAEGVATNRVASTAETMTKGERLGAIKEGRLEATKTGGGTFTPSDTEKRAGKILAGKLSINPVKNVPVIQKEIAKRGTEAEQFLGQNGRPILDGEHEQIFADARDKVSKYLTESQLKDYDATVGQFEKELDGMGNLNTGTYYKALKNFEQNVTQMLPKGTESLLTDSGSAKLEGAKAVRSAVRDMIGAKNPEFKSQMFDLTSLYDALDNTVSKAEQVGSFGKRHPIIKGAVKYGAEAVGAGAIYEGAKSVGAPLP